MPGDEESDAFRVSTAEPRRFRLRRAEPITVEARYADRWRTPMAGAPFKLWVEGTLIADATLIDRSDLGVPDGEPLSASDAARLGTYTVTRTRPGEAELEILRESGHEQSIVNLRDGIAARLDGAYNHLVENMREHQALWDEWGYTGVYLSYTEGFADAAWDSIRELGEKEYWIELGDSISSAFFAVLDAAENAYEDIVETVADAYENRERFLEWAWWSQRAEDAAESVRDAADALAEHASDAAAFAERSAAQAQAVWRHRRRIALLPEQIANGDVDAIESFVDNELRDIDSELAEELRNGPRWQGTIELLNDGESLSLFVVYISMFMSAVPPTFFGHAFGQVGFYITIELLFLAIGLALGGAGAAARVAAISARVARLTMKTGSIGRKVRRAQQALTAFRRMLDDLLEVADDLDKLRDKLRMSRRQRRRRGRTNQTIEERRETEQRRGRCRVCHRTDHRTPRQLRGCVEYR